jgi:hypothetical protein
MEHIIKTASCTSAFKQHQMALLLDTIKQYTEQGIPFSYYME